MYSSERKVSNREERENFWGNIFEALRDDGVQGTVKKQDNKQF